MMKTRRLTLILTLAAFLVLPLLGALPAPRALAQGPEGGSPEERALREAITALGWPDNVRRTRVYDLDPDDETLFMLWPPSGALRYFTRTKVAADNGADPDGWDVQYARILALGEEGGRYYMEKMSENGLTPSSYQGRTGVMMRYDQELCGAGGLVGVLRDMVVGWLREILGDLVDEDVCPSAAAGLIAWSCGSHTFVVRDDTGQGAEDTIAAALYLAAQNQGLCDLGDTLVILAGTDDTPGNRPLSHYQQLAQDTNSYYGQNAYGQVALAYTFLDADGDAGHQDWYNIGGSLADYAGQEGDFALAALAKAYEAGAPRDELNLARVVVVYPGPSAQATHDEDSPAPLSTLAVLPSDGRWHEIEVGPADARATVYAGTLILVAEEDGLGLWAHEVGHSLYSRHPLWAQWYRISDRYNYQQPWGQYGRVGNWGLMGSGNWWGDPSASNPVHMTAFSKEAAGWLTYQLAEPDERYTLAALEAQGGAATALRIDDPTTANPEWFFLLEARQAGGWYGAPQSGVVLYQVSWSGAHGHHIVNAISAQTGPTIATAENGRQYLQATLREGGATVYRSPNRGLEFVLYAESNSPGYSATVGIRPYTPTNLVGASASPVAAPAPPAAPNVTANVDGPLPDIDLHAYDDQGRHVGWNHVTGEYEIQIPGAVASGDLRDAEEWIYVPEGTVVRYVVSAHKTEQFLAANPHLRAEAPPHEFEIGYSRFGADGTHTVARGGSAQVIAGEQALLPPPDDPSLSYRPAPALHYGRNWPSDLPLIGYVGVILVMGAGGWIVGLLRR